MADTNKQMAEFARELWENYIKPKFIEQFTDTVTYYMATVVTNDGNNRATIKRPFDDPYQVTYLDDMAGLEAGDTVLVLRFGNGTNNANHIIFGKGNGNMNYTAANATQLANAAIKTIEYGVGTSPTSHSDITSWSSETPQWEEGKYIWQRTSTNDSTYTYACIQGAEGAAGVSISDVTNYYLATSQSSGVTRDTSGWTTSIQTMTSTNQYLWNYEVVTGSNGSTLNTTDPIIIGRYGQDGTPGSAGRGITAITEYYLVSDQQTGITPSTSGWTTTVQTTSTSTPYLWNYEVITYTSGSPDTSDARIIGTHGATGAAGAAGYNAATVYLYQRATATPNKPSNNLTYTFSTGTLSGTIDNNWAIDIPTGTNPIYVIAATAFSNTATDLITTSDWSSPVVLAQNGTNGSPGTNGINTATVYLYQRKATIPNKPSNTLTYTFATGALTGTIDNDWSTTIPSGTDPLFVTFATAASTTATDTIDSSEWVTPEILAENGEDGTDGTDGTDGKDGQMLYATSSSAATTVGKTATLTSGTLTLEAGATVAVTFTHKNTAASPTLNVSSTGAKTIRAAGADLTATSPYNWTDGATVTLVYDGTYWQLDGTASLLKADDASKVATNYISDVGSTGIEVSGNNATSKVQIEDTVKVITDSTHFAEMTATQFKIHSGNVLYPTSYLGTKDAAFAGDGAGHYLVRIYEFNPSSSTAGGALELRNVDGKTRVRLDAYGDYGSQLFYNANADCMVSIGSAVDGSYGALQLYQTTTAISQGFYNGATLGKVIGSLFVNAGTPALLIYEEPTPSGSGYTSNLSAAYGGGAAYIRASATFAGYVAHGKTISHRLTYDFDTISGYNYLRFWIDGTEIARIQQQSYSDERVKTDIEPIKEKYKEAAAAVDIDQFRYDFGDPVRQGAYGVMFGIVAQDLIKELDDRKIHFEDTPLVSNTDNDDESLYSVDYTQFLLARIAADEDRIKALEVENTELKKRLDAIEEAVAKLA